MIPNDALINILRSQNFTFKRQTDRINLYRQRGGTTRVAVKKSQFHTPEYARSVLRIAGVDDNRIKRFLAQYNN